MSKHLSQLLQNFVTISLSYSEPDGLSYDDAYSISYGLSHSIADNFPNVIANCVTYNVANYIAQTHEFSAPSWRNTLSNRWTRHSRSSRATAHLQQVIKDDKGYQSDESYQSVEVIKGNVEVGKEFMV